MSPWHPRAGLNGSEIIIDNRTYHVFDYHKLRLNSIIKRDVMVHNNVVQDFSPADIAHLKVRTTFKW